MDADCGSVVDEYESGSEGGGHDIGAKSDLNELQDMSMEQSDSDIDSEDEENRGNDSVDKTRNASTPRRSSRPSKPLEYIEYADEDEDVDRAVSDDDDNPEG